MQPNKIPQSPDVVEIANGGGGELENSGSAQGAESCTGMFLGGHFLFTCSHTLL